MRFFPEYMKNSIIAQSHLFHTAELWLGIPELRKINEQGGVEDKVLLRGPTGLSAPPPQGRRPGFGAGREGDPMACPHLGHGRVSSVA